jgi:type IX secretion system PorP/SprF family membrane protein
VTRCYIKLLALVVIAFMPHKVLSQDIHYTNFGFSPLNINPALAGAFRGDVRFIGNYRNQWNSVPVGYSTASGAADMKLGSDFRENRPWRAGVQFNHDQAGDSHLTNIAFSGLLSYAIPISEQGYLSIGGQLGFINRNFKTLDLYFDDQYRDGRFNPNIPSSELILDKGITFLDASAGINYHHQVMAKRTSFDLGVGLLHFNRPVKSFHGDSEVQLPARVSIYGTSNISIAKHFDLLVDAMGQFQGPHAEFVLGVGGRLYLVDKFTEQFAIQAGLSFRNADAIVPHIGFVYNQWKAAVNFDVNFSQFKTASVWNGGPEINVIYIFSRVPPAKYCPISPVFL